MRMFCGRRHGKERFMQYKTDLLAKDLCRKRFNRPPPPPPPHHAVESDRSRDRDVEARNQTDDLSLARLRLGTTSGQLSSSMVRLSLRIGSGVVKVEVSEFDLP